MIAEETDGAGDGKGKIGEAVVIVVADGTGSGRRAVFGEAGGGEKVEGRALPEALVSRKRLNGGVVSPGTMIAWCEPWRSMRHDAPDDSGLLPAAGERQASV